MNISHTLVLLLVACIDCAKILGIFNVPSKSHHMLGETLLKGLAFKGHEVTMLSPFKSKDYPKNFNDMFLPELQHSKDEHLAKIVSNIRQISTFKKTSISFDFFSSANEAFYNHTKVKKLISLGKQYDVAIVGWFGSDTFLAVPQHLAKYTIIFCMTGTPPFINEVTKNPYPSSYVPNVFPFSFPEKMNFLERLQNSLVSFFLVCLMRIKSRHQSGFLENMSVEVKTASELYNRVSLVLLNTHYSIESTRPYVPQMVQIGGLHLEEPKPLTGYLKQFMDDAKDGVILFSLGSNARSTDFEQSTLHDILKCFSKLPYQVLWKFEKDGVLNLPRNVKISDWLPQRDLLAHKNMKVFITHGGLLSTMEAIYYGVPLIGIPLFGDQNGNVNDAVVKGYAIGISPSDLSEDTLCEAVEEMMKNPKYSENIQNRTKIFRDRSMKPLDKAIYWVEYVLRHNGAFHLQTSATKLYWFQLYLLDVIAVIFIFICVCVYAIRKLSRCCYTFLWEKLFKPSSTETKDKLKTT